MTFRCPDCKSSNYSRHPNHRPSPVGPMLFRWHECRECSTTFITIERVAGRQEVEKLAEAVEAQIRGQL